MFGFGVAAPGCATTGGSGEAAGATKLAADGQNSERMPAADETNEWTPSDKPPESGKVVDVDLRAALGKQTVQLNYNTIWVPIESTAGSTLIEGSYETWSSYNEYGPLVFQDDVGAGRVLYTSFHNEAQAPADMEKLTEEVADSLFEPVVERTLHGLE